MPKKDPQMSSLHAIYLFTWAFSKPTPESRLTHIMLGHITHVGHCILNTLKRENVISKYYALDYKLSKYYKM